MAMKWVAQTPEPATRPVRHSHAPRMAPDALRARPWKAKAVLEATPQISAARTTRRRSCWTAMQVRTANTKGRPGEDRRQSKARVVNSLQSEGPAIAPQACRPALRGNQAGLDGLETPSRMAAAFGEDAAIR